MALVTLCHEIRASRPSRTERPPSFTGFIVDHGLRPGSGNEARKVADELDRLSIRPHILKLDWTGYDDPPSLPNFESVARKLRYQALGRACRDARISSLLVGHHADDQAETVLMRMTSGYTGTGLRGISSSAPIPECRGIYGVDASGPPFSCPSSLRIEAGGVQIHRPLLRMRKQQLVDVCRKHGVHWFEDHTNADATLTLRNTVRSLLKDEDVLPHALQRARLLSLAEERTQKEDKAEAAAGEILDRMSVSLNIRSATATFNISAEVRQNLIENKDVARRALRQMLSAVSPKSAISLQDLDQALEVCLDSPTTRPEAADPASLSQAQVAGVQIQRRLEKHTPHDVCSFTLFRSLPPAREQTASSIQLWSIEELPAGDEALTYEAWRLWDGRYWIRALPPESAAESGLRIVAKLLNKDGLAKLHALSKTPGGRLARDAIEHLKTVTPYDARLTLPAVFAIRPHNAGKGIVTEEIVALPSLGWFAPGWTQDFSAGAYWRCDIRYKQVELREDQVHDDAEGIKCR